MSKTNTNGPKVTKDTPRPSTYTEKGQLQPSRNNPPPKKK